MKLNGIAHVQLSVADFARSREFYGKLLPFLEMTPVIDAETYYYCVGSRTGVAITPADPEHRQERFAQRRVGLHHLCFRARSREQVDELHDFVRQLGATVVHPPEQQDAFAPGYYSLLFEDPDGIRLEVNFVPGRGLLEEGAPRPEV